MDPDGTPNKNRLNAFDDIKMVLDGDGKIVGGPWEATTQPGKYWTEHPMASGGAFIIALGPQACWTLGEYHGLMVWRQAEDSRILGHRDPDRTYERHGPPTEFGNIGVHHHGGYDLPREDLRNAAAGCQVIRLRDDQAQFMRITRRCPRYLKDRQGYRLTATVLTAQEVGEMARAPLPPKPLPQPSAQTDSVPKPTNPAPTTRRAEHPKPDPPPAKHFGIGAAIWAAIVGLAHWAGMKPYSLSIIALCALLIILFLIHRNWEGKQ
jgi:hypothetical protein